MKNLIFGLLMAAFVASVAPACSKKSGCPATESLKATQNKKGQYKKSKKTESGLFSKKMSKKMGH